MKDTLRILKKNAIYLGKDAVHTLEDLLALIIAFILLILQLIAAPFKAVLKLMDVTPQHAKEPGEKPTTIEVEDVPTDDIPATV